MVAPRLFIDANVLKLIIEKRFWFGFGFGSAELEKILFGRSLQFSTGINPFAVLEVTIHVIFTRSCCVSR